MICVRFLQNARWSNYLLKLPVPKWGPLDGSSSAAFASWLPVERPSVTWGKFVWRNFSFDSTFKNGGFGSVDGFAAVTACSISIKNITLILGKYRCSFYLCQKIFSGQIICLSYTWSWNGCVFVGVLSSVLLEDTLKMGFYFFKNITNPAGASFNSNPSSSEKENIYISHTLRIPYFDNIYLSCLPALKKNLVPPQALVSSCSNLSNPAHHLRRPLFFLQAEPLDFLPDSFHSWARQELVPSWGPSLLCGP